MGGNYKKINVALEKDLNDQDIKIIVDTFKHIEKEMDLSWVATLKLRDILKRDVPVERGVQR